MKHVQYIDACRKPHERLRQQQVLIEQSRSDALKLKLELFGLFFSSFFILPRPLLHLTRHNIIETASIGFSPWDVDSVLLSSRSFVLGPKLLLCEFLIGVDRNINVSCFTLQSFNDMSDGRYLQLTSGTYLSAAIFGTQHCKSTTLTRAADIISCRTSHNAPGGGFPLRDDLVQLLGSRWNILRLSSGVLSKVHEIRGFKTARYCGHDRIVT